MLYIIFRKVEKQPSTAVTVLSEAYEESRPAKKPNQPRKMLVQIIDLNNTKDILKAFSVV